MQSTVYHEAEANNTPELLLCQLSAFVRLLCDYLLSVVSWTVFFSWVTGEFSTLRQMTEVPNEPGLSPNNGLENASLNDQSMASNARKGQAKRSSGAFVCRQLDIW